MTRLTYILLTVLLAGWAFVSSDVRLDSYGYTIENNQPVVRWVALVENQLERYELHRKTMFDSRFDKIAEITPQGPGNPYTYRDEQVYKFAAETVEYELFSVSTSGVHESHGVLSVNYTPTAVRRTWGSIKAMFQ